MTENIKVLPPSSDSRVDIAEGEVMKKSDERAVVKPKLSATVMVHTMSSFTRT